MAPAAKSRAVFTRLFCGVCFAAAYVVLIYPSLTVTWQPADSSPTSGAIGTVGTVGTHPALTATGELKCGVLWFLHIPKTGGDTVKGSLQAWSRQRRCGAKQGRPHYEQSVCRADADSSRWTYVDIYQGSNNKKGKEKAEKEGRKFDPLGSCEPGLDSTNMEDWAAAPSWQRVLRELAKPTPRVALQSHHCSPSLAALLPQLEQLNATLQAKGCGLHLVTVLREPVSHTESRMHYKNYNQEQ